MGMSLAVAGCTVVRRGWAWREKNGSVSLAGWHLRVEAFPPVIDWTLAEALLPLSRPMWQFPFTRWERYLWDVVFWGALAVLALAAVRV